MPLRIKRAKVGQQEAASSIIVALHQAKQELAVEMEANLKQLKAVLIETRRIARDMEAVLKEARGPESTEESPAPSWKLPGGQQPKGGPGRKAETGKMEHLGSAAGPGGAEEQGATPEQWSPPRADGKTPEGTPPPWRIPTRVRSGSQGAKPPSKP